MIVNIWIASRSFTCRSNPNYKFRGIKEFCAEELGNVLASFRGIRSLAVSTPLGPSVGSEGGYMDIVTCHGARIYKRGTGDRCHPFSGGLISSGFRFDGMIHTSATR